MTCDIYCVYLSTGPTPTISRKSTNSPSSVFLAWTTPWQLKFLRVVTGYVVQYGTSTAVSSLRTKTISTTQVSYSTTVTGLAGGTTYYFRVAVSVRGAQGPYSSFTSMRTVTPSELCMAVMVCCGHSTDIRTLGTVLTS